MKTVHRLLLTDDYAAEAQQIVIAENPTLRWKSGSAWVRWGSRIVFAGDASSAWPETGIDIAGAYSSTHVKRDGLRYQPAIRADGVLLKTGQAAGVWLPDRMLSEGTPGDVRRWVSAGFKGSWYDGDRKTP